MNPVRIAVDRQHLAGRIVAPAESGPAGPGLLFIHGWGSSQRRDLGTARQLVALGGWVCLTFNLRGHARTRRQRDTVTRAQNLRDAVAAYDLLASHPGVDVERIGVVGCSYGGYLAVLLTAERKVRWLALQAPALYKDADFDRPKRELNLDATLPAYRRRVLGPTENRALRAAATFGGDVLVMESENDCVIPAQVVVNYMKAFGTSRSVAHQMLEGADHGLSKDVWRQAYGRNLRDWLARQAGSSVS